MKLSEAIRLGAMLKPQGFDGYQNDGASCALGAAMDACGITEREQTVCFDPDVIRWLPSTGWTCDACPACGQRDVLLEKHLLNVIAHLNDDHEWTREQIADWVASVEAAQATGEPASVAALDPVDGRVAEVPRA